MSMSTTVLDKGGPPVPKMTRPGSTAMLLLAAMTASVSSRNVFPSCPWDCPGTATDRVDAIRSRVAQVDLSGRWDDVREELVQSCGLAVGDFTGHCFNDFNHVDCCAMKQGAVHRTNSESLVPGMHAVNHLGAHITGASDLSFGPGGSWCTCHLNSPFDVCHKQFGASTAFKLVWCEGTKLAALVDDSGNLLNWGTPTGGSSRVPGYGGDRARFQAWGVLVNSPNETMSLRWHQACDTAKARGDMPAATRDEL